MRHLATIGAALLLLSCGGNRQGRFREIADHANPIIMKLKPAAAIILDEHRRSDVDGINKACLDSLGVAQQLGTVHFNDRSNGGNDKVGVDDVIPLLSSDPAVYCKDAKRNVRDEMCRDWCVDRFRDLADALERAHDAAAKENVQLELLRK